MAKAKSSKSAALTKSPSAKRSGTKRPRVPKPTPASIAAACSVTPTAEQAKYLQLVQDLNIVSPMLEQVRAMLDVLTLAAPHVDSLMDHSLEAYCIACEQLVSDARNIMNGDLRISREGGAA